ncbi:MAG: UvrB/UvrC motif-containing protein [Planctomycetota bacterium]
MLCEACQKKPATVHLTDVSNNTKQELHLCDECAKGQGVTIKSYMYKEPGYPELLPQLVETQSEAPSGDKDLTCPRCGMSFRRFRSTGKFGCPHDYVAFQHGLGSLLEKIHGRSQHVGKVPSQASDELEKEKELVTVRAELERAIQGEDYERAVELRDRIYQLEGRDRESREPHGLSDDDTTGLDS